MSITVPGFRALTDRAVAIAGELCEGRLVAMLEGGYSLEALTDSVAALMPVLVAESPPEAQAEAVPVHGLALQAAERLAPWWPAVGAAQRL